MSTSARWKCIAATAGGGTALGLLFGSQMIFGRGFDTGIDAVAAWVLSGAGLLTVSIASRTFFAGGSVDGARIGKGAGAGALAGLAASISLAAFPDSASAPFRAVAYAVVWSAFLGALAVAGSLTAGSSSPRRAGVIAGGAGLLIGLLVWAILRAGYELVNGSPYLLMMLVLGVSGAMVGSVLTAPHRSPRPDSATAHALGASSADGNAPAMPHAPSTNGLAIASLVLGLTGVSVIGLTLGLVALSQIKRSGGTEGGRGMAIAGVVLSALWLAIVVAVLAAGVIFANSVESDYGY